MTISTSLPVQPHLYIGDGTGRPLDNGMVYFGQPNKDPEFYPINIYYNEAKTVAATQPVRTKGGFLNANGDMAEVYANEMIYSVKVLDAHGVQVFYKPTMRSFNIDDYINSSNTPLASTEAERNQETKVKYTPKRMLFIGDSLTENITNSAYTTPRESYARVMSDILASKSGGFKELSYISLSTENIKDLKGQVSLSRQGFTDMWGASDHKWNELPFKYSPDGRGFFTEDSVTTDRIFINTVGNIAATRLRLYYLKQPDGGAVRVGYSTTPAIERIALDTASPTYELGVLEFEAVGISERIIISSSSTGKKMAFYGLEFIDDNKQLGIVSNYWARSGAMLQEFNDLVSISEYYSLINPDTVFLNIGTNDALQDFSRLPTAQFRSQLILWMDRFKAACPDAKVYIVEPNRPAIYGTDKAGDGEGLLLKAYSQVRAEVATIYDNTIYIDVPKLTGDYKFFMASDFMADALHPNAFGKYHIAEKVIDYMSIGVAPDVKYDDINPKEGNVKQIASASRVISIGSDFVTLATYGLRGRAINAYFNVNVVATFTGKTWVTNAKAYAIKTVQSEAGVYDVRGLITSEVYRYDITNTTSKLELQIIKTDDDFIAVQAKMTGPPATEAREWVLSGEVMSPSSNPLIEIQPIEPEITP